MVYTACLDEIHSCTASSSAAVKDIAPYRSWAGSAMTVDAVAPARGYGQNCRTNEAMHVGSYLGQVIWTTTA